MELQRPLNPVEVARASTTPELAAEMYLASLLVINDTSFMERAYLDELRCWRAPCVAKNSLLHLGALSTRARQNAYMCQP